ncbi:MAG: T9SS type A sorting domain-containing protein [Bacteroidia bacterium]|nr:T9SS type A sorting domain-containing protein [Bacteroidia bacterium]
MKHGLFFTLLLLPVFQLVTFAHSATEAPVYLIYPNPFADDFAVESEDADLKMEVFTLGGQKIPSTIYKFHHDGRIRYETGRELTKGLYLVRLFTKGETFFQKMMKIN